MAPSNRRLEESNIYEQLLESDGDFSDLHITDEEDNSDSGGSDSSDDELGLGDAERVQGQVADVAATGGGAFQFGPVCLDTFHFTQADFAFTQQPGVRTSLPTNPNEFDCFKTFFNNRLIEILVTETNRYAQQRLSAAVLSPHSRLHAWTDTNEDEMMEFLSLILLMGVIQKPTYEMYWSRDALLETKIFSDTMSLKRFELLVAHLHFVNNETLVEGDRLRKIRTVLEVLKDNFQTAYCLKQDISVDESLVLWKGRLVMKQYLPLKRARFGIKIFMLCEVASGYAWNFSVYTGKGEERRELDRPEQLVSHSAITKLVCHPELEGKGYNLYCDRWFTSPLLFKELHDLKFGVTGTVNPRRRGMPKDLMSIKLKKNEVATSKSDDLIAVKW